MTRTRGGGRVGGGGVDGRGQGRLAIDRRRPTASVRRERGGSSRQGQVTEDIFDHHTIQHGSEHDGMESVVVEEDSQQQVQMPHTSPEGFLGGPVDTSLLRSYGQHVARCLWDDQDRGELKLVSHGRKLGKFGEPHKQIRDTVISSGLSPLIYSRFDTADKGLVSAFVERWHRETNSFHLPVGEMTITLDDVSSILHLPISGAIISFGGIDSEVAVEQLIDLLGASEEEARVETRQCRGPHVRLSWLRDIYGQRCQEMRWTQASRAYLLHLVGCTIFTDKSSTSVCVAYLEASRDLRACAGFAWGAAALTHMCEHLKDGSFHKTKQLGGYITLLQAWIYEHFHSIGVRVPSTEYAEALPRAMHYSTGSLLPLPVYRRQLDDLTTEGVIWMPYEDHRVSRPFEMISLFSGYIKWGALMHRHMPERVLRQYGFVQTIPRHLSRSRTPPLTPHQMEDRWLHFGANLAPTRSEVVGAADLAPGYMDWFFQMSHPFIIPRVDVAPPTAPPSMTPDAHDPDATTHEYPHTVAICRRIAEDLQVMIDLRMVTRGTEAYDRTERALRLARSVTEERLVCRHRVREDH